MATQSPPAKIFNASFPYQPLGKGDWIRLVFLLPSCDGGVIECDIKTFPEESCPPYEALSYVWGNANDRSPIQCCGQAFDVTKNLESALLQLRLAGNTRLLWIDAICINQLDKKEQGQQVSIMDKIYSKAIRTVVWLGEAGDQVDVAFDFLSQLDAEKWDMLAAFRRGEIPISSFSLLRKSDPLQYSDGRVIALRALLKRQWFTRIWVAQEVGVAKKATMVCGEHEIEWSTFYSGYERAQKKDMLGLAISAKLLERINTLSFAQETKNDLANILIKFRSWNATNPRDKVFGLRGLCNSDIHKMDKMGLAPDYEIKPEELWMAAVRACIRVSGNLNILSGCRGDGRDWPKIPSWAPNWSDERPQAETLYYFQSTESASDDFKAAGNTTASHELGDGRELHLMGHIIDPITELTDSRDMPETKWPESTTSPMEKKQLERDEKENWHNANEFYNQCERLALSPTGEYPTGEKHRSVYWQTITAGQRIHGDDQYTEAEFEKWFANRHVDRTLAALNLNRIPVLSDYLSMSGQLMNRMIMPANAFAQATTALFQRRMARTRCGYLGLVPGAAEVGDWIAICRGGGRPLVIRMEGDCFRIVGECYVHGMMKGERWDDEDPCKVLRFV